ncbi:MAG: hypothetical protein WCZ65_12040 [Lysobacteraceae bacterium]
MNARRGLLIALLALPAAAAMAQMEVDRSVIAAGGGSSSGGDFEISGTLGQHDADALQPASGGGFELLGGFWAGLAEDEGGEQPGPTVFADGFEG